MISLPLVDQLIGKRIPGLAFHNVRFGLFVRERDSGHLHIVRRHAGHTNNCGLEECAVFGRSSEKSEENTHKMVNNGKDVIFKIIRYSNSYGTGQK